MSQPHIYVIIIGSEILNGRRKDRHFDFIKEALTRQGHTPYAVSIIKDDKHLITRSFELVLDDDKSMLFCFGGIGSTPDDLTRAIAAEVFTAKPLVRHKQFEKDIIERFGEGAFPNRIEMADLPEGAELLHNPVNNMSGFSLEQRFFFTPGFPEMAHSMVEAAIEQYLPENKRLYRNSFLALCSEERFIALMKEAPEGVECSSLPMFVDGRPNVEISVASYDEALTESYFRRFIDYMQESDIDYEIKLV